VARQTLFMAGAEYDGAAGNCTEAAVGTGCERSTAQKRTGLASFKHDCTVAGQQPYIKPSGVGIDWNVNNPFRSTFGFYSADAITGSGIAGLLMWLGYWSGTTFALLWAVSSGSPCLQISSEDGATIYATSAPNVIALGSWNELCVEYIMATHVMNVYVGGTLAVTYTTSNLLALDYVEFLRGATSAKMNPGLTVYTDDLYVASYVAGTDIAPPKSGIMAIRSSRPISNSAVAWTPSAGTNYACVDEAPSSDTDYVYTSNLLDDLYGMQSCATIGIPGGDYIWAVKVVCRAKTADINSYDAAGLMKRTTTIAETARTLTTAWAVPAWSGYGRDIDTEGAAWTQANLDNTLGGMRTTSGSGGSANVSAMGFQVAHCATDYTPAAGYVHNQGYVL